MRRKGSRARRKARIEDVPERSQKLLDRLGLRPAPGEEGLVPRPLGGGGLGLWAMGSGSRFRLAQTRHALGLRSGCESGQNQDRFCWPEYLAAWRRAASSSAESSVPSSRTKTSEVPGSGWREASLGVLGAAARLRLSWLSWPPAPPPHRTSSALHHSLARLTLTRTRPGVAQGGRESGTSPARVLRESCANKSVGAAGWVVGGQQSDGAKDTAGIKRIRRWARGRAGVGKGRQLCFVRKEGRSDRMRRNEPE